MGHQALVKIIYVFFTTVGSASISMTAAVVVILIVIVILLQCLILGGGSALASRLMVLGLGLFELAHEKLIKD